MNRRLALWTAIAATMLVARGAAAQTGGGQGEVTIGYQGLPYKPTGENQTGIQVSEGVLAHVGAGAEAGYDSNVFYSENAIGSQIYRATLFGDISNASRTGLAKQLSFDARAGIQYRRYQSDDASLGNYRNAWMPTAGLALSAGTAQVGFGLADTYARIEDPPYAPTATGQPSNVIIRNNNQAMVEGRWSPGGGRLTGVLRYMNMVDVFDQGSGYGYASSDTNLFMLDVSWKWLPKTAVFLNAQQGYVFYLNDAQATAAGKASLYPLRVTAGLRGLLTEKTSTLLQLGYQNAFYANGVTSTGGFLGSSFAELAFTVRPTELSRIVVGYRHDFQNSVISQFYYAESAYASYVQQIGGRVALDLSGRYVYKNYQGLLPYTGLSARTDNFFQVGATLDYFVRNWVYAGLGYALLLNDATLTASGMPPAGVVPPGPDAANYTKQQVFVRFGLTY
jgi:hypothetical protein